MKGTWDTHGLGGCRGGPGASFAGIASAMTFSPWGTPTNAEAVPGASTELNTALKRRLSDPGAGRAQSLHLVQPAGRPRRPGHLGGASSERNGAWGAPENLGAPVNSASNDFCPTPLHGKRLLFVTERGGPGSCGSGDIYITRLNETGWAEPQNLGCQVNSAGGEAGPSLVDTGDCELLYFSSTRAGGLSADAPGAAAGDSDIYVSIRDDDDDASAPPGSSKG